MAEISMTELEIEGARLQTPPDVNGQRKDIHPITDAGVVTYEEDDGTVKTVQDKIKEIGTGVVISKEEPDHSCLWIQEKRVEETTS